MPERDEQGRPVATRNAGAFLAPLSGVVPAPSSMLDEAGGRVDSRVDAGLKRRLRLVASADAVAVWAVLSALFRYVLAATAEAATVRSVFVGDEMTQWMHTDAAWIASNAAFVAIGLYLALRRLPGRRRGDWLQVGAAALAGAVLLGLAIAVIGGYSAAFLAGLAMAWLAAGYALRRRLTRSRIEQPET